jgi:hypothetical protein
MCQREKQGNMIFGQILLGTASKNLPSVLEK